MMDIDINLVAHAKDYLDDLAKGINPFTKQAVDDNDIINNVKISRCLFYVSDVLEEVINNGGINPKREKKPALEAFDLSKFDINNYIFSSEPVTVSAIVKSINELKPENMKNLKVTAITNWLVDINMLSNVQINSKNYKRPTAGGEGIGITMEQRNGQYGLYHVVLYSEGAQHFIIDNLSAIIDAGYNEKQKKASD